MQIEEIMTGNVESTDSNMRFATSHAKMQVDNWITLATR